MNLLITGGAGYIGSHTALEALRAGHGVTILDSLIRSSGRAVDRLRAWLESRGEDAGRLRFVHGDVSDPAAVDAALDGVGAVVHMAGLAYVGESVERPVEYYRANVGAPLVLLEGMARHGVGRFVFSSTCATYGVPSPERVPIREDCPQRPINPYGWSKLMFERVLADFGAGRLRAGQHFGHASLRYFNAAGCDPEGLLGEEHDPETHLIPVVLRCLLGQRPGEANTVAIFGTDYPTADGTAVRDYIHVSDLAQAHLAVLQRLGPGEARAYNLGTGRGASVREVIAACERVSGRTVRTREAPRREGDPPVLVADPALFTRDIGWTARWTDLDEIVRSAWAWFSRPGA